MTERNYGGLTDTPGNEPRRRLIDTITNALDRLNAIADRKIQVGEYQEIRIGMLVAGGMSELAASARVDREREENVEVFEGRALDLFAYRQRLTEGDGAIPSDTFQYVLDRNPQRVLDDSRQWAELRSRHDIVAIQ